MSGRMRVLCISHSHVVDGYRRVFQELGAKPGIDLTVLVPDWWIEAGRRVCASHDERATSYRLIRKTPATHRQHAHFYPGLGRVLRDLSPDVVFLVEEPFSAVTALTLRLLRRRSLSAAAGFYSFLNDDRIFAAQPWPRNRLFPWAWKSACTLSDFGVACTKAVAAQLLDRGYQRRIAVIPYGADVVGIGNIAAKVNRTFASTDSRPVVGFVGRLDHGKGSDLLLHAIAKLHSDCECRVVIVGDGPLGDNLRRLAGELGLAKTVRFVGSVSHGQVAEWIAAMDVLVVPSRRMGHWREQFGRVVVEAMACRTVVVGSNSGAIPDVLGDTGFVFPEDDVVALQNNLRTILAMNQDTRCAVANAAYIRALHEFDYAAVAVKYYNLFTEEHARRVAVSQQLAL